jgi:urate oxidase
MAELGYNAHGKGRVRVVKVTRHANGMEDVLQLNVKLLLEGEIMADGFKSGDNSTVVATDTCKNTVYCLAKMHDFQSIEEFGLIICKHFLSEYPDFVNKISVEIVQDRWERITSPDSRGNMALHKHAFLRKGPNRPYVHAQGSRNPNDRTVALTLQAGVTGLEIMKTTQSGFSGFHRDRFTSLPEVGDRLVGTSVSAEWSYNAKAIDNVQNIDFKQIHAKIEEQFVNTFAGPSDTGIFSNSVQQTMYEMGEASLKTVQYIDDITMEMPNIHNIAFDLTRYGFDPDPPGVSPTIFFPIDEPHGIIRATIERKHLKKSPIARSRL